MRDRRRRQRSAARLLVVVASALVLAALGMKSVSGVPPGSSAVRVNRLTGAATQVGEGPCVRLPLIHELRVYPLRVQVYRTARGARADGEAPFKSFEGLALGVEASVQWSIDRDQLVTLSSRLPLDVEGGLVAPTVDSVLHRTLARHSARSIFSSEREQIQHAVETEVTALLARDGIVVRSLIIGNIDLPREYRQGLEALLAAELESEKMKYTIELKEKEVRERELGAEAERVESEKHAEAQAEAEVIAAKGKAEAMKHILPFKEKEIEQRKLEAEAQGTQRIKLAEADAVARKLEAAAEADSRRQLAEAEAFRIEVTGKAQTEQLARDSELIAKNPLLIQKTLADKLSDKIQVIVAPPPAAGFFAEGLLATGNAKGGPR